MTEDERKAYATAVVARVKEQMTLEPVPCGDHVHEKVVGFWHDVENAVYWAVVRTEPAAPLPKEMP